MSTNLEKFIKIYQYDAQQTISMRQKMRDGTFFDKENQIMIDEFRDDSKIEEDELNNKSPRIGPEYQVLLN